MQSASAPLGFSRAPESILRWIMGFTYVDGAGIFRLKVNDRLSTACEFGSIWGSKPCDNYAELSAHTLSLDAGCLETFDGIAGSSGASARHGLDCLGVYGALFTHVMVGVQALRKVSLYIAQSASLS